jgi:hypothetical protein
VPTTFIRKRATLVKSYGPIQFECDALAQRHDDCMYVPLSHDQLYVRFADVWPEVLSFIKSGHFTADANRSVPTGDALQPGTNH